MRRRLSSAESSRNSPGIGLLVAIVEWLQTLHFLLLAEACGVGDFEESWSKLHQPTGVNCGHLSHVFLCGQHQLVVH